MKSPATLLLLFLLSLVPAEAREAQRKSESRFAPVTEVLEDSIRAREIPGAVVVVGHKGQVVYRKAIGWRALQPRRETMSLDTVFDLASLTKPVVTATAIMQLWERGKIRLNDPVWRYLPELRNRGKDEITVRQLLTHYSGLREDLDLRTAWSGRNTAFELAMAEQPLDPPGARFRYSDINFLLLGWIVERVSGTTLDRYAEVNILRPLGMTATTFLPPAAWRSRTAPTDGVRGDVHDPTARRMGGVAGHAGLFGTAADLAKFAQALLGGTAVLKRTTVAKMTAPQQPPHLPHVRGFGWDIDSPFASNRGEALPVGSFGHTGFAGTSLWIDPATQTYIVLLTNSVHIPFRGTGAPPIVSLRARVATAVSAALNLKAPNDQLTGYNEALSSSRRIAARNGEVKQGIDVLIASGFAALRGKRRVGVVTNHTGLDAQGRRTIDVLASAPGMELKAIFSPEHGLAGKLDTEAIGHSTDAATGVAVYSVYGSTEAQRRPAPEVMRSLDAVVFDIQDVGTRFYTYITTLRYFLEAAAAANIDIVVLDRVNPITGSFVQGPLSTSRPSFTNPHPLPLRHGMTVGELARLFNAEREIGARLTVVPVQGWQRGDWLDSTGLVWTDPSPNMRSLTQATLYAGVGLVEQTNVSVGRGTNTPFEVLGAPWIRAEELARYLNARQISGIRFVPIYFTPAASQHAGQRCGGVNIIVTDRNFFDAPELGVELASALRKLYPDRFNIAGMQNLLANDEVYRAIVEGQDPRRIADGWRDALQAFTQIRQKYLLY